MPNAIARVMAAVVWLLALLPNSTAQDPRPPAPECVERTLHLPGAPLLEIRGRVVSGSGTPVAGARLWAIPNGRTLLALGYEPSLYAAFIGLGWEGPHWLDYAPLEAMSASSTSRDGRFTLGVPQLPMYLTPGDYAIGLPDAVLAISAAGFATATLRVRAGTELAGLCDVGDVVLQDECVAQGRVVDELGRGIRGASVRFATWGPEPASGRHFGELMRASLPGLHSATTDDAGRYVLCGLMPGTAAVHVDAVESIGASRTACVLAAGGVQRLDDIVLRRGGRLRGRVVDGSGIPVAAALLFATDEEIQRGGRGCVVASFQADDDTLPLERRVRWSPGTHACRSDAQGRFELLGVPPVEFTLYAEARGFELLRRRGVRAGGDVELVLEPEAVLRLTFRDARSGERLAFPEADGVHEPILARRRTGVAGDDPPLRVEFAGGQARVHGAGPLGTRLELRLPGRAFSTCELPGVASGSQVDIDVPLHEEALLSGRVVDAAGSPVSGVRVLVGLLPGDRERTVTGCGRLPWSTRRDDDRSWRRTDAAGSFRFDGLPAGEVAVRIAHESGFADVHVVTLVEGAAGELRLVTPDA